MATLLPLNMLKNMDRKQMIELNVQLSAEAAELLYSSGRGSSNAA